MQNTKLIGPAANYVAAANAQDSEAVTANFSEGAIVRDEGRNWQGIVAIRQWAVEVTKKYHPTIETLNVAQVDGRTVLTGRVSGNFPGSPVELRYVFTLNGEKIERLEIS